MNTKHLCPQCSFPLLSQIKGGKLYWYCSNCHDEVPYAEQKPISTLNISQIDKQQGNYDIVLFVELDGKIVGANHQAVDFYGYNSEELLQLKFNQLGLTSTTYLKPDALTHIKEHHIESIHYHKNGQAIPVEITWQNLMMGHETVFLVIIRNMTQAKQLETNYQKTIATQNLIHQITTEISHSKSLTQILNLSVDQIRSYIESDRVLIIQINQQGGVTPLAESITTNTQPLINHKLGAFIEWRTLPHQKLDQISAISDITQIGFHPYYSRLLENLLVKSELLIPLFQKEQLWGWIIIHQCHHTRQWTPAEIELLTLIKTQIEIAINQAILSLQLQSSRQMIQRFINLDGLTQLPNRRTFESYLTQQWDNLEKTQHPLSLMFCEVDFFQNYNETYGTQLGDDCLQKIARTIKSILKRPTDLVSRYTGKQFAILLPLTDLDRSNIIANEICLKVQNLKITHIDNKLSQFVTLSLGISSTIPNPKLTPVDLLLSSQRALQQAILNGRNQVYITPKVLGSLNW